VNDILTRLDAAIGGPDRRTRDGRVRKLTPLKVETQLLVDAKAEIERLRQESDDRVREAALAFMAEIDRLRQGERSADAEIERLRAELAGADSIANGWQKQNLELRRLLRFFFKEVPDRCARLKYHESYADVMTRTEEILGHLATDALSQIQTTSLWR
jgi:hypothetical protein